MEKTKVGVIGLGGIAQLVHLPIISRLETVKLVSVAEINKNKLKTAGEKYSGVRPYADYKEMIVNEDLDAVIISTPTDTHEEIALACLESKKNVLIEKPVARNFREAKEIAQAAKKVKKVAMVGMNSRFRPDTMLLRSIINSGELGDLFYINCSWLRRKSSAQKWFVNKNLSGGGVIIDLGIVILDLALWMMGQDQIHSVSVQKFDHTKDKIEDSAIGMIRFQDGKVINFEVSWELYSSTDSFNLTVHGTKGTACINPLRIFKKTESSHIDYSPNKNSNIQNLFRKSYENELRHFIGAVREGAPVISSVDESLTRMKLLEALYKSAEHQKEIKL
ncbi:MAG TPA: Gfo/Idh/MocA family oxidoreductase [Melioribacteraceae bacterium]|nr:Gfo/Idh/MocA family oxidoreductase [Melioribacteraceae bacterium]